tara:strand:+ start:118 stop:300 length:183 start_codon:yes stop_codon:yes gene_type:complete
MWVDPENDPNLVSVADKLAALRKLIDEFDWQGKPVDASTRNEAKRLTQMVNEGTLWEPKF